MMYKSSCCSWGKRCDLALSFVLVEDIGRVRVLRSCCIKPIMVQKTPKQEILAYPRLGWQTLSTNGTEFACA